MSRLENQSTVHESQVILVEVETSKINKFHCRFTQMAIPARHLRGRDGNRWNKRRISVLQWLLVLWMASPLRDPSPIHNSGWRSSKVEREGRADIRGVLNLLCLGLDLDGSLDIILIWNLFFIIFYIISWSSLWPLCKSCLPPGRRCVSHLCLATSLCARELPTFQGLV